MKRYIASAVILLLLCGCQTVSPVAGGSKTDATPTATMTLPSLAPLPNPNNTASPSSSLPLPSLPPIPNSSASNSPSASVKPSTSPKPSAKDADWLIQVDDTQDYTQPKSGLLYHCNLYIYATKSGGKDVLGDYKGQVVLKMELDAKAAAEKFSDDDTVIDSITGAGTSLEADDAVLTVQKYSSDAYTQGMKLIMPTSPLLQMPPISEPDAITLKSISMKFRYLESTITAHDSDGGSGEGWSPGVSSTPSVPIVLEITGGTVFVSFPKYGFDRDFKGTIVGTVR